MLFHTIDIQLDIFWLVNPQCRLFTDHLRGSPAPQTDDRHPVAHHGDIVKGRVPFPCKTGIFKPRTAIFLAVQVIRAIPLLPEALMGHLHGLYQGGVGQKCVPIVKHAIQKRTALDRQCVKCNTFRTQCDDAFK